MALLSILAEYPYCSIIGSVLLCIAVKTALTRKRRNPARLPLPPGPRGLPVIGNLLGMPQEKSWLVYDDWKKTYGDIIYFEILGQPFIILGSLETTNDLFEKRSSNYSDRARMPMILELMNWGFNVALLPYGQSWRKRRRAFHEHFHPGVVGKYQPIQLYETRVFLRHLLETPDQFLQHIRLALVATIMRISYGMTIRSSDDPYVRNAEEALAGIAEAGIPGTFLVDFIPALKYIPGWFPGAAFQKKATRWRNINEDLLSKPFEYVKQQMKACRAVPSVASSLIENLPDRSHPTWEEEEQIAQGTAAVAYTAGADTTMAVAQMFFLAMIMYPDVMKKAQAEIDSVIGPNRLPEFADRPFLPYINAMVKESLRWHLVGPLALGHMASEDDEYKGYFIPKGTVMMGNAWSILNDPEVFKNPAEYNPERYLGEDGQLDPNVRNPTAAAFGYGRRICPGRHLSDNALFIIIASTLAVYNVEAPLDEKGEPITPKHEVTSGLLSYPVPFKGLITPRSPSAACLVKDGLDYL